MNQNISRRKALSSATATLFLAGWSSVSAWGASGHQTAPVMVECSLLERLSALFHYPESACNVGRAYLATAEGNAGTADWNAHFAMELEKQLHHPDADLRPWFRQRVSRDFEEGRVVCLDGWILAETEVEVCALLALAQ